MTCNQLGGACNLKFKANTFEGITAMSKNHGKEMFLKGDKAHLKARSEMRKLMSSPETMNEWFENKRKEFDQLPDNK